MSIEENKAIMRRIIAEYNKQNLTIIDELMSPAFIYHGPVGDNKGMEDYRQACNMILTAFPDHHLDIEDMVAEGDKVVTRLSVSGTHQGEFMGIAPTGKKFKMNLITINRIVDGKVVEEWESADMLTMMQQLGVVPAS